MASAMAISQSVLSITIDECPHRNEKKSIIAPFSNSTTFIDIFNQYHDFGLKNNEFTVTGNNHEISPTLTVGEVVQLFNVRDFKFKCVVPESDTFEVLSNSVKDAAEKATKHAVNAFQLLMAGGRSFPALKSGSVGSKPPNLNRKDEMFNKLIDKLKTEGLDFPRTSAASDGSYFVQVLCNALWCTTNDHATINDASKYKNEVLSFPAAFMDYDGFNDVKRKKMKALPMSSSELESHAQALFSLLMKPVVNSSAQWKNFGIEIQSLAECYLAYSRYLNKQNMNMQSRQALPYPARTVDKDATLEHRQKCAFGIKPAYQLLENAVKLAGKSVPVMFDEFIHTENPFSSNDQRFRFFKNLQLSMPVDVIKYSPGGSCFSTVCLVHVPEARSEAEILTQGARFLQQIKPKLKEFHTRAQRRLFKEKLKNVASVLPSVADMIYKELTLDASVAAHPVTEERMRLIFLGNTGLIRDLRSLNPGRPSGTFDTFFDALAEIVENVTIADDRRHGLAHFSDFISLEEMIKKAQDSCPEGTNIPSKTLVRLQFAPKNPYTKRALNFTSRINVQYKIQRRQLRVSHPDDHFCNAQFKYMKERAIVQRDQCLLLFCDDKAKVPFGDPDHAISTGVRGKQSIVPTSSTLVALDHDMTRSSLTPSVFLLCDIPETINASFIRGQVTTIVNDAIFQTSSPFRHGTAMAKMIGDRESIPPILMKYTDGGTDQRNTLESVKCATICLFRELNLDMIILARCAPGHSYTNPAERVMSILNLGLQNVCLQRKSCEAEVETQLKRCGSMAELREAEKKNPDRKLKEKWLEAVEPTQSFIRNRFLRLCLKDKPFAAMDPVSELEIDNFKRHLRELFPGLDLEKLTKANTGKNGIYNAWIANHCRSRNYTFQIKKCNDVACCIAPKLSPEELHWLPDPVLDLTGNHFKPYSEVKNTDTDDSDRPSVTLKVKAKGIKEQNQQKKKKKEKNEH